jgi:hypothetical protein
MSGEAGPGRGATGAEARPVIAPREVATGSRRPRRPNYFIVGAPKCGTSSLFDHLGQHPQVFNSPRKEPFFFGTDLPSVRRPTLEEYLELFGGATSEKAVGEASTAYLHSRRAASEIRAFEPSARIIVCLRSPVDLIVSFFNYRRWQGAEPEETLEAALAAERRREETGAPALLYRGHAAFTEHLTRYFETFGRDAVHVVLLDDLRARAEEVYRRTLEFLGVDPTFRPDFRVVNPTLAVRSRAFHRFIARPPSWLSAAATTLLPLGVRHRIFGRLRRLNSGRGRLPGVPPDVRARLIEEYRPEVERLSDLLGRDLRHWSEPPRPESS